MKDELGAWNGGDGIDLEGWMNGSGTFSLAVAYCALFWPAFELVDGYILRRGVETSFLRGFEASPGQTRQGVELVLNHLHIADIHKFCEDTSKDKLIALGICLKQIYEAKLLWQFPDRPCIVDFYQPADEDDFEQYQLSFWQRASEGVPVRQSQPNP